jgi:hypothetical protein
MTTRVSGTFLNFSFLTLEPLSPASLQNPELNNGRDNRLEWYEGRFHHYSVGCTSA